MFHAHLSENQLSHLSNSDVGWLFGINVFLSFFGGIQIGPLFDKYGPRWLLLAGSTAIVFITPNEDTMLRNEPNTTSLA